MYHIAVLSGCPLVHGMTGFLRPLTEAALEESLASRGITSVVDHDGFIHFLISLYMIGSSSQHE